MNNWVLNLVLEKGEDKRVVRIKEELREVKGLSIEN